MAQSKLLWWTAVGLALLFSLALLGLVVALILSGLQQPPPVVSPPAGGGGGAA